MRPDGMSLWTTRCDAEIAITVLIQGTALIVTITMDVLLNRAISCSAQHIEPMGIGPRSESHHCEFGFPPARQMADHYVRLAGYIVLCALMSHPQGFPTSFL